MVFKKGNIPWNIDKECPNISSAKKGKSIGPMSESTKRKISESNKGNKRPDLAEFNRRYWKGKKKGPRPLSVRLNISASNMKPEPGTNTYRRWALNRIRLCERCGRTDNLWVHHKDGNRKNNKLENLMVVCPSCHAKIHEHIKNITDNYLRKAG